MKHICAIVFFACTICAASAQTTQPATRQIDACGTLVRGAECVLFDGGGGKYVLADYGKFKVGDAVRVVGTVDPACATICGEGDGCIRGSVLYDPSVFPCGTPVKATFDPCSGLSGALLGGALAGLWFTRRQRFG